MTMTMTMLASPFAPPRLLPFLRVCCGTRPKRAGRRRGAPGPQDGVPAVGGIGAAQVEDQGRPGLPPPPACCMYAVPLLAGEGEKVWGGGCFELFLYCRGDGNDTMGEVGNLYNLSSRCRLVGSRVLVDVLSGCRGGDGGSGKPLCSCLFV